MKEVVIVDGVRTPIAKSGKGSYFANIMADEVGAIAIKELVRRTGIDPTIIEDVIWGVALQWAEQGYDLGRTTVLVSGLPLTIPGTTVDRYCASGLQTIQFAVSSILSGWGDTFVAGGCQHMSHIPMGRMKQELNPKLAEHIDYNATSMGWTAEFIARERKISREEQDEFALWSHEKAAIATKARKFKEMVPVEVDVNQKDGTTKRILADTDQGIRYDATMEAQAKLQPLFATDESATVTAGNASQTNDAAAACLVMSADKARELGLKPRLKMVSFAVTGTDPRYTMLGPVLAIPKVLARAGMSKKDIDVWEVNEAFACQSIIAQRELDLPRERLNMWGSGLSLGHPLGCTGARMTATLMNVMDEVDAKYGVVSMCAALGHGAAAVFERIK